jgi:hypothetical protein
MTTAYDFALRALRSSRTDFEEAGGSLSDPTTAIANADGTLNMIPLDILSDPVNLKKMWSSASFPMAILFRELMDDWYALFPADIMHSSWNLMAMPGSDHDMRRAQALAERAIRSDFNNPAATVSCVSAASVPRRTRPAVEPAHDRTATLSD